ncbi:MAG: hypothetical protein ABIU96_04730 [Rhodanobacter sp.]
MQATDSLREDLQYVTSAVRQHDRTVGIPVIYYLWAAIVLVGYALPDFAARLAGPFWFVAGFGGGLLSWWLASRDEKRRGVIDRATGRRWGLHWVIGGVGFLLSALPMVTGHVDPAFGATTFLLTGGLIYAFAGVHLERPMLWSGLIMLAAYAVLVIFAPPYVWTISGIVIAFALCWAGVAAQRQRRPVMS